MKHTPAPWKARRVPEDSRDDKIAMWIDLPNGAPIADVRTRPDEEHVANAALIAAAPELLEALDNATTLLEYVWDNKDIPPAELRNMIDAARAAIQKAEAE